MKKKELLDDKILNRLLHNLIGIDKLFETCTKNSKGIYVVKNFDVIHHCIETHNRDFLTETQKNLIVNTIGTYEAEKIYKKVVFGCEEDDDVSNDLIYGIELYYIEYNKMVITID
jgi:hypothetical protein